MVFDIKMDLTRKCRIVAGGHKSDPPKEAVYSSVVTKESVRIILTIAALNDLDILAADIQNAYLNAPTKEKVWARAGLEFGASNVGRVIIIIRAWYGLKSSGARWHDHISATLREAGFFASKADPDVWMRKATKPDGFEYWEYVLIYVDDILAVSGNPKAIMDFLAAKYTLKEGSVKEPDTYLGARIFKWRIDGADDPEKTRWGMSAENYIKLALKDIERILEEAGKTLPTKAATPFTRTDYRPELDATPELNAAQTKYYQGMIGVLRWCIELGRVDILHETTLLSSYLMNPREGHLEQVFHMFGYLKKHLKSSIVFDDTMPNLDGFEFKECDWSEQYPGAREPIPSNAPDARGNGVSVTCYVDASHAGCRVTRRSHTGIFIFINRSPIVWFSKRQNTVESSTFGSEFVALRIAVDLVEALRYKLRMFGIPIDGPASVLCDNKSVVTNTSAPESTLKKKHNSISFHRCREAQAARTISVAWVDTQYNLADLATKVLPGPQRRHLLRMILW